MFNLRCTVRNCFEPLKPSDSGLRCAAGHCFDRSKQGYFNLLQPQDRKSKHPGDIDAAVLARHRWLERGYADGLIQRLQSWIPLDPVSVSTESSIHPLTLDLGCGEGYFGPALFSGEADGYCGIDLSKRAIKLAARRWPDATWILANADRTLPARDASVHRVLSLFGRRPVSEIARVLAPGGICIVAVPGEDDLVELRQHVQQAGHRRRRWETIADELAAAGLEMQQQQTWRTQIDLDTDAIADAMAMTYRAVRFSQNARLETITNRSVTLSADLILAVRKTDRSGSC
ncbi:23S rRNA (guanine(745)-N(1))-methyltransferase [Novipirellula aureliae]|uniref:23S rRNA (Guanine(745)-N(1))-methyltransferase n=1 Tax=Novipirellula aureliae TaxID=2527966 RepID=A0A5C6E654_9BACT|nr:methyltransferase domain-containing protein [Novipirellula aureliae]TWU45173.1 23S rRNA (guanine(745)-N(1))-methyltransferase [Novipirellula aureliae]